MVHFTHLVILQGTIITRQIASRQSPHIVLTHTHQDITLDMDTITTLLAPFMGHIRPMAVEGSAIITGTQTQAKTIMLDMGFTPIHLDNRMHHTQQVDHIP
jgi:ectoine hydroxylase-related dioxygenase (phytanoyl-CoA dioxygenase family)